MILFLCYVFPPLAVLCMGRPFSMALNCLLTVCGWVPGVKHALVLYADWKVNYGVNQITAAVHNPQWSRADDERSLARVQGRSKKKVHVETIVLYDNPHVGVKGTHFRSKH